MTEKEFVKRLIDDSVDAIPGSVEYRIAKSVSYQTIQLVKQFGLITFDPEPVDLSKLVARGRLVLKKEDGDGFVPPSQEEAKEIVRRCKEWDKLRPLIECVGDDSRSDDIVRRRILIAILDGKDIGE